MEFTTNYWSAWLQICKQMAEFDDFNFDMSSDEGEFEGFAVMQINNS
jgi:hypothetical protein